MPDLETPSPTRNIDIGLLRAFAAVATTGSMTLAAKMLHRTQGAVSQQIARLETLFEARLFDRRSSTLSLTADGERMLTAAHRMIAENDALLALMRREQATTELRVGMPPDIVRVVAPPVLRAFTDHFPNVRVTLVGHGTRVLREMVNRGDVDLALATDASNAAEDTLFSGELIWVGAEDGFAHHMTPIPVALGEEECAFRSATVAALVNAGIEWRSALQIGSLEPVLACLSADTAIGVFMEQAVPAGLQRIESDVLPKLPNAHVNLVRKQTPLAPEATAFLECLHEFAQMFDR